MLESLIDKREKLAVIGLGYVGLPIAVEFAKKISVIGFDINAKRVEMIKKGIDPSRELEPEAFQGCDIEFTANPDDLHKARFFVVAVPTPIDEYRLPDLQPLLSATELVGKALKKGDYVVYESTVYPSCTENECVPILERMSGLEYINDFKVGFSPERINPGDKEHTLTKIVKVTSGCDEESAEVIARTYELIIKAGVHRASSIMVAEAAKIIENTQRDINIAFMNELSLIFNMLNINTYEVLEAAGTKWNFLKFFPGLVGGHCIGVDPYYLVYKAKELGYHPQIISSGRSINDSMGGYVAEQIVKMVISQDKHVPKSRVLIMGVTFKENVSDIRNTKVVDIISELQSFGITQIDVIDPCADTHEVNHEYGFHLADKPQGKYDVIVLAVNHREYLNLPHSFFKEIVDDEAIFVDIKGVYRKKKPDGLKYWSL